jgi:hypothetical protein
MRTIGETNQDVLRLQAFLDTQPHGAMLSYAEITRATAISMDMKGRSHLRVALKHCKREYSCVRGVGVRLADASAVMPILSTRIRRIDKAVRRADRSHRILQDQFFQSLSEQEQKKILFAGAVFGAIRLAAEQGREIQQGKAVIPTIHIPLPVR